MRRRRRMPEGRGGEHPPASEQAPPAADLGLRCWRKRRGEGSGRVGGEDAARGVGERASREHYGRGGLLFLLRRRMGEKKGREAPPRGSRGEAAGGAVICQSAP